MVARQLRALGYPAPIQAPELGRPTPGAAGLSTRHRARGPAPNVLYAFGHQHIGLTLCAVTAQTMADLSRPAACPRDVSAFDLRRFGVGKSI